MEDTLSSLTLQRSYPGQKEGKNKHEGFRSSNMKTETRIGKEITSRSKESLRLLSNR